MADCYEESPLPVFHMTGIHSIPQGTDWDTTIIVLENDVAVDFTLYSAKLQVRKDYGQEVIIELNSNTGTIVLASGAGDPPTPNIVLKWTPTQTTPLSIYEGIYDLELTAPDGKVAKYLEGKWELRREVTL